MKSVLDKILEYNAKRNKDFVPLKYKALTENPHRFFRGTNHLFVEYILKEPVLKNAPFVWGCGDLHLENFGSYKGGNGLVYFDINDFDEAAIVPCTIDLVKLCTSIFLVGEELKFSEKESTRFCNTFLDSYKEVILKGHASRIEGPTATGIIKTFFNKVQTRKRKQFLKDRVVKKDGGVLLRTDLRRYYPLEKADKKQLETALNTWVIKNKRDKDFFSFIDAAFRIAGTGSLGLNRYCILIKGNGKPNYCLLDVKQAETTCLEKIFSSKQIKLKGPAYKVVHAQKRMNDTAPAGITTIQLKNEYYIFKEHRPQEDKFSILSFKNEKTDFTKLLKELGELVAWAQLRSSGLDGTANGDDLIKFAATNKLAEVIPSAKKMYKHILADYRSYLKDYNKKINNSNN